MATYKLLDDAPASKHPGRYVLLDDNQDEREFIGKLAEGGKDFAQGVGNLAAGAIRGAGSIGATLIAPYDIAKDALSGRGLSLQSNRERRTAIDEGLRSLGAEPEALTYKGGKLAGEIAGTAGTGQVLARGAQALGAAPSIVRGLQTAGMTTGANPVGFGAKAADLGVRMATGAGVGGFSAGLVNPEDAGTGALVGGALPAGAELLKGAASIGRKALGATTGVGEEAITEAYKAGQRGGAPAKAFREAMRGESSMDDVLNAAKQNLEAMGKQRQAAYREGMARIKADKTVLEFKGIDKSLDDAVESITYKGMIKSPAASDKLKQVYQEIDGWKKLDPAEYHTPEGLDALKQRVGDILESIPYNEQNARRVVGNVYNSIKKEIAVQAPEYSKAMKGYSEASETIKEIERSLSLGQKSTAESGIRKLQSLMRNNVNTSYGKRGELARTLEQAGGREIFPAVAGQSLNDWLPRGIQRAAAGSGGAGLALTGNIPAAAGLAAVSSPRLVGEAAYGVGKLSNTELAKLLKQGVYYGAPVSAAD